MNPDTERAAEREAQAALALAAREDDSAAYCSRRVETLSRFEWRDRAEEAQLANFTRYAPEHTLIARALRCWAAVLAPSDEFVRAASLETYGDNDSQKRSSVRAMCSALRRAVATEAPQGAER